MTCKEKNYFDLKLTFFFKLLDDQTCFKLEGIKLYKQLKVGSNS